MKALLKKELWDIFEYSSRHQIFVYYIVSSRRCNNFIQGDFSVKFPLQCMQCFALLEHCLILMLSLESCPSKSKRLYRWLLSHWAYSFRFLSLLGIWSWYNKADLDKMVACKLLLNHLPLPAKRWCSNTWLKLKLYCFQHYSIWDWCLSFSFLTIEEIK